MNLRIMNEAFKRRYSDVLTESVDLSCKEELRKELKDAAMKAISEARGLPDIAKFKRVEIALQAVLERNFPDNLWWEVTNCQIFWDLMEHQNASLTCDNIIDKLNSGFCEEDSSPEFVNTRKQSIVSGDPSMDPGYDLMEAVSSDKLVEIANFLDKFFYKQKMDDIVVDIDNNQLIVKDDENEWRDASIFEFIFDDCLAFDSEGNLMDGLGAAEPFVDKLIEYGKMFGVSHINDLKEAVSLKEDWTLETIKEEYVYLPTPDGKADIHVMFIAESFDGEIEYGIDIDWGSASKISDKISEAIWKYSYENDRFILAGENRVEIPQKGFVESLCCWNDEDFDVINELYNAVVLGLMNIDTDELNESKSIKKEAVSNPEKTISKVDKNLAKEVDKDLVRDLTLCIENDGEVYRRSITPVIKNLKRKKAKGQFDEKLAIQAFFHVVEGALKMPHFYRYYTYSIQTVSVPERYAVAKELLDGSMDEIEFEDVNENLSTAKLNRK